MMVPPNSAADLSSPPVSMTAVTPIPVLAVAPISPILVAAVAVSITRVLAVIALIAAHRVVPPVGPLIAAAIGITLISIAGVALLVGVTLRCGGGARNNSQCKRGGNRHRNSLHKLTPRYVSVALERPTKTKVPVAGRAVRPHDAVAGPDSGRRCSVRARLGLTAQRVTAPQCHGGKYVRRIRKEAA